MEIEEHKKNGRLRNGEFREPGPNPEAIEKVYGALADEMKTGVHALAITSRTPSEWAALPEANVSPKCLGGNGK